MSLPRTGFSDRGRSLDSELPPGQHLVAYLPALIDGSVPTIRGKDWTLAVTTEAGLVRRWDRDDFCRLTSERVTVDLHDAAGWSTLGTSWQGVNLHTLVDGLPTSAQ